MANDIASTIARRFAELVVEGKRVVDSIPPSGSVDVKNRPAAVSWLLSVTNLLEISMPENSRYRREATGLLPDVNGTLWCDRIATVLGVLESAATEWRNGLISSLELRFAGLVFEDFLRQARIHNDEGRTREAAILASAVLEDTVKRLCAKHNIVADGKGLDASINALKGKEILGRVKAERLRSFAALRNQAFHAQWDAFDEGDLRHMIEGLEELLEMHFVTVNPDAAPPLPSP